MRKLRDFPKRLLVKSKWYTVKFRRKLEISGQELDGLCMSESGRIEIALGQQPLARLSTLIHEVVHALDFEYGVGLTHPQVYKLEKALLALLLDNDVV